MLNLNDLKPFPQVFDNTMRTEFVGCPRKFFYSSIHNLAPIGRNVDLHAGGAFARGMEVTRKSFYDEGKSAADSINDGARALIIFYGDFDPGESVKTCERMIGALASYFAQYPLSMDHIKPLKLSGRHAIEFSFACPIDVLHPVSKEPIIYCGRFDMLGLLNDNVEALFVVDEKTTKQLGPTWSKQWNLRSQFMGYTWGARQFGHSVVGAVVRGVSILKEKYGHAEAIVYFPQWRLDSWYRQLCLDIERAKQCWENGYFDYNYGGECATYGGCKFSMLCETNNPNDWIDGYFKERIWDPLAAKGATDD